MKKILSIAISIVIILSMSSFAAFAAESTLGEKIAGQVFSSAFDSTDRTMFVELIQLYQSVDNKSGLAQAYGNAFSILETSGQAQRLTDMGLSMNMVLGLANFVADQANGFSIAQMKSYLGLGGNAEDPQAFAEAIDKRESSLIAALSSAGADVSKVESGISRLDKLFSLLRKSKTFYTSVFIYNTQTSSMSLDISRAKAIIVEANDILTNKIEDIDTAARAMGALPDYYNGAGASDKSKIYSYLDEYKFIVLYTPSTPPASQTPDTSSGGSTPPSVAPPTASVTIGDNQVPLAAGTLRATVTENEGKAAGTFTDAMWEAGKATVNKDLAIISSRTAAGNANVKESAISLNQTVLKGMVAEKVKKVLIDTDVAGITFEPDVMVNAIQNNLNKSLSAGGKTPTADELKDATDKIIDTSLDIKKMAAQDVFKGELTKEQKNVVASGKPIYNISLSYTTDNKGVKETKQIGSEDIFTNPVIISIPYTPAVGEDADNIVVYYVDAAGVLQNLGGAYDPITGVVRCPLNHFSIYMISQNKVAINDINSVAWASKYINEMAAKGFISGDSKGLYHPKNNVTRAEFAKMIVLTKSLILTNETTEVFTDVPKTQWYSIYVNTAAHYGLVSGTNHKFNPMSSLTRQEMAVIIVRALGDKAPKASYNELTFNDKADIASSYREAVAKASKAGILNGNSANEFSPKGYVTRAESAAILSRLNKILLGI